MIRAFLIASPLVCFGCRTGAKTELLFVVDYSGSTEQARAQQQAVFISEIESAETGADFRLFRMGFTTDEVMSGSLQNTPMEAIISNLKQATDVSDKRKCTNFAKMAQALAMTIANSKADRIEITIATDGGDDYSNDPENARAYTKSVGSVCGYERVQSVSFVGVLPANRAKIRSFWSVAGDRLHLQDPSQVGAK